MTCPFTKLASSEPKKIASCATSSGCPVRGLIAIPNAWRLAQNSLKLVIEEAMFVMAAPGAIPLQRMFFYFLLITISIPISLLLIRMELNNMMIKGLYKYLVKQSILNVINTFN